MSEPRFTLTLEGLSSDALTQAMIKHIEDLGYGVTAPNECWETPSEFLARIEVSKNLLSSSIRDWEARGHRLLCVRGGRGRIKELLSNPAFDAFCRRHKR